MHRLAILLALLITAGCEHGNPQEALGTLERDRIVLEGDVPSPINPPEGSAFGHRLNHPRYEETIGMDLGLVEIEPGHLVAADPCCLSEADWKKAQSLGTSAPV